MIIFNKADALHTHLQQQKRENKKVGFVPTMGALHAGHLSLIEACKAENDVVVCSIFVNPTQFNNPEDFKHYPITIEKDIEALINAGCSILFLPSAEEIYPEGYITKHYDLGELENVLEGYYRPGHFQGVCQVVERLLQIVDPNNLYMGIKDYQQCMVVKKLITIMGREDIQLNLVTTMREKDGLAMSSRNMRLSGDQRDKALIIHKALSYIKNNINQKPFENLKQDAVNMLEQQGFKVDYVSISGAKSLEPIAQSDGQPAVALIAATIGEIRLIDNMLLN